MFFYARSQLISRISDVRCGAIANGSAGMANKGAVAVACSIGQSHFVVVNAHLAAGGALKPGVAEERFRHYRRIMKHLALKPISGERTKKRIKDYAVTIWTGDQNS